MPPPTLALLRSQLKITLEKEDSLLQKYTRLHDGLHAFERLLRPADNGYRHQQELAEYFFNMNREDLEALRPKIGRVMEERRELLRQIIEMEKEEMFGGGRGDAVGREAGGKEGDDGGEEDEARKGGEGETQKGEESKAQEGEEDKAREGGEGTTQKGKEDEAREGKEHEGYQADRLRQRSINGTDKRSKEPQIQVLLCRTSTGLYLLMYSLQRDRRAAICSI